MIRRVIGLLIVAASFAVLPTSPALAGCHQIDHVQLVQGIAQINSMLVCDGSEESEETVAHSASPPRDSGLDPLCVQEALGLDTDPFAFCAVPVQASAVAPTVTPTLVSRAFRRLPLPPSELVVQPPNGRTLVNFETNFYTENGPFTRAVTLLGRRVELRIWPSSYGWRFGDGATEQTTSAGSPYPDLEITHRYLRKGAVRPSVDTTYAAEFSVDGGPWREVSGTVTIPGGPEDLRVVEARPVLVGSP